MKKILYLSLALLCGTQSAIGWTPSTSLHQLLSWGKSQVSHVFEYAKQNPRISISLGMSAAFFGLRYLYRKICLDTYHIGVVKVIVPKGSLCKIENPRIITTYPYRYGGQLDLNPATQEIIIQNRTGYFAFIASKAIERPFVKIVYNTNDPRSASTFDNTASYHDLNKTFTFGCDGDLDSRVDYIVYVPWHMRNIRYTFENNKPSE